MTASTAPSEPRGIAAAMSQPVFSTRTQERSLSAADRASRRWAPEAAEDQPRSVRSLSFVDRTVAPWISTAQRSAGLRMFSQYAAGGTGERTVGGVSWVFPRPWYQDELDWIAASRAAATGQSTIFTTRGTYAAAGAQPAPSMSSMSAPPMIEYVAPSFASGDGSSPAAAYSPLVAQSTFSAASIVAQSMRAIQTASAMARGLAPSTAMVMPPEASSSTARTLAGFSALAPLVSQLIPAGEPSTSWAIAQRAPELVTPPSPRGDDEVARGRGPAPLDEHAAQHERGRAIEQSRAMAQVFAQERERLVAQERQAAQERQVAQQRQLEVPAAASSTSLASMAEAERVEALRESLRLEISRSEAARVDRARVQSTARQQARIDAMVAERMAQQGAAGVEEATPMAPLAAPVMGQETLVSALRFAELMAHTASVGPSAMAPSAGPRVALPTGLGGLVAAVNTVSAIERERAMPTASWAPRAVANLSEQSEAQVAPTAAAWSALQTPRPLLAAASFAPAFAPAFTPAFAASLEPQPAAPQGAASSRQPGMESSALGAVAAQRPHALAHIAWSDRWLGRFAGASEPALEAMSTVAARARLAPEQLFLAPALASALGSTTSPAAERGETVRSSLPVVAAPRATVETAGAPIVAARPEPMRRAEPAPDVLRFADDDVVPDEMLAAIMAPRPSVRPAPAAQAVATAAAPQAAPSWSPRVSAADVAALTAPAAPVDAGLSAALASSPMAPALQHVLPMPRAAVFDARALAGAELATAFLSGALTAPILSHTLQPLVGLGSALTAAAPGAGDEAFAPSSPWRQWAAQWTSELVQPIDVAGAHASGGATGARAAAGVSTTAGVSGAVSPALAGVPTRSEQGSEQSLAARPELRSEQGIVTLRSTLLAPASPRQQQLAASFGTAASFLTQDATDAMPTAYQTLGELLSEVRAARGGVDLPLAGLAGQRAAAGERMAAIGGGIVDETGAPIATPGRSFELPMVMLPSLASASPALGAGLSSALAASTLLPSSAPAPGGAGSAAASPAMAAASAAAFAASSNMAMIAPLARSSEGASSTAWPFEDLSAPLLEQSLQGSMERNAHLPGMTAQRALGFGAVQSTQAADLSFDFVPPELVLAARVYGFGPAEAAQAVRLAMAGPTGLSSMASAVDLRFVALASPAGAAPDVQRAAALGARGADTSMPSLQLGAPSAPGASPAAAAGAAGESFGVERRMPRGAFLLPSASVAAMGLSAAMPDGEHAMPVAALEILAAKLVAELGTFAGPALAELGIEPTRVTAGGAHASLPMPVAAGPAGARAGLGGGADLGAGAEEASEAVVLSSAAATVGAARRARFDSLYVALSESPAGRTMSPAARAARALALANRDEESPTLSSRERAALAWQIYPVVLGGEVTGTGAAGGAGAEPASRAARGRGSLELPSLAVGDLRPGTEMRPGLGALSARAGEALTSFVTSSPVDAPRPQASSDSGRSPSWRSGRFGGGEVEIPTWFEAAARKMFEEQRDVEGISLAELTLIASPPPQQLAASSRDTPAAAPSRPAASESKGEKGQKVDIEKVAREVYKAFMDICRSTNERNGNPYL